MDHASSEGSGYPEPGQFVGERNPLWAGIETGMLQAPAAPLPPPPMGLETPLPGLAPVASLQQPMTNNQLFAAMFG